MKTMANGAILRSKTVTPIECLHYALNLPTSVVITGVDRMEILEQAFEAVRTFKPLTSSIYDGTATNPQWLGEEPEELQAQMQA